VDISRCYPLPNLIQHLKDLVVESEDESHIETDAAQPRRRPLIECKKSFILRYRPCTVQGVLVLVRLKALHASFHNINWSISENTRSSSDKTSKKSLPKFILL